MCYSSDSVGLGDNCCHPIDKNSWTYYHLGVVRDAMTNGRTSQERGEKLRFYLGYRARNRREGRLPCIYAGVDGHICTDSNSNSPNSVLRVVKE